MCSTCQAPIAKGLVANGDATVGAGSDSLHANDGE
jgi:hypothetical protein